MNHTERTRVFVVDDEWLVADTLCAILHRAGYEAFAFRSAIDAMDALPYAYPAVVISDVMLDGMYGTSGIELERILMRVAPDIKVILMSGHGDTAMLVEDARKRGQWVVVHSKPIAPAQLLRMVQQCLQAPSAPAMGIDDLPEPEEMSGAAVTSSTRLTISQAGDLIVRLPPRQDECGPHVGRGN